MQSARHAPSAKTPQLDIQFRARSGPTATAAVRRPLVAHEKPLNVALLQLDFQ